MNERVGAVAGQSEAFYTLAIVLLVQGLAVSAFQTRLCLHVVDM